MDIGLVMVGFLCVWLVLVGVVLVLADAGGGLEMGFSVLLGMSGV